MLVSVIRAAIRRVVTLVSLHYHYLNEASQSLKGLTENSNTLKQVSKM